MLRGFYAIGEATGNSDMDIGIFYFSKESFERLTERISNILYVCKNLLPFKVILLKILFDEIVELA